MSFDTIVGDGAQQTLTYADGTSRQVIITNVETNFPIGELIVSQTDVEGRITMCNEAFVRMSGFTRDELIGQPHSILRHPDMPRAAFADLWATVREGRRWSGYVKNLRKDGGYYWVYATVIPKIRHGQIVGHTSVRREPSRNQVNSHIATYQQMLAQEEGQ
ncbi:MAG: PAS domain-containing protein [Arachnia sp.]